MAALLKSVSRKRSSGATPAARAAAGTSARTTRAKSVRRMPLIPGSGALGFIGLRALGRARVEDHLEDDLRYGYQRVGIAVRRVDFAVAKAQVIGHGHVGAFPDAVAAAVGVRRISHDAADSDGEGRVTSQLIRVTQTLKPLHVVGAGGRNPLRRVVERKRQRAVIADPQRRRPEPRVEPSGSVASGVVRDRGWIRRRTVVRKLSRVVGLEAAVVRERKAAVL